MGERCIRSRDDNLRGKVGWRDRRVIEEGQVMVGDRGIEGRGR